jgi:hypothetical protein
MKEFFVKLFSHLSGLFKDNGVNNWSSSRFVFLFSAILSNLVIFGLWLGLCIYSHQLLPIDTSIIVLYGIANGITSITKLVQKKQESDDTTENTIKKD